MSKTNNETIQPEVQAPETQAGGGLKLDVNVRPIAPMGNLLAFANVTIGEQNTHGRSYRDKVWS